MNPRIAHLKVKIKSLAFESKFIRQEERKAVSRARWQRKKAVDCGNQPPIDGHNSEYESLRGHRKGIVGPLARVNLLAYAFLRGKPYAQTERDASSEPKWSEIEKIAARFDNDEAPP